MLDGKGFGLGQGFAGDDGNLDLGAGASPVKHQILDRVGGQADQRRLDLFAPPRGIRAGRMQRGIQDLSVWNHQLGRYATR